MRDLVCKLLAGDVKINRVQQALSKLPFFRVIPSVLSDTLSGILSGILCGILFDISSEILCGRGLAGITFIRRLLFRSGGDHCDRELAVGVRRRTL